MATARIWRILDISRLSQNVNSSPHLFGFGDRPTNEILACAPSYQYPAARHSRPLVPAAVSPKRRLAEHKPSLRLDAPPPGACFSVLSLTVYRFCHPKASALIPAKVPGVRLTRAASPKSPRALVIPMTPAVSIGNISVLSDYHRTQGKTQIW